MFIKRNDFEQVIPVTDLRVGMKVCVRSIIAYGWRQDTTLNFYHSYVISRITPKRTKIVCEDYSEFNSRETTFLKYVPEMDSENYRVKLYRRMRKMIDEFSGYSGPDFVSSESEMREAVKNLHAVRAFLEKNLEARKKRESDYGYSKKD